MQLSTSLTVKTNNPVYFTGITLIKHIHEYLDNLELQGVGTWTLLGCWGEEIVKKIRTLQFLFNSLELLTEHLLVFGTYISKFCCRMYSFALLKGQLSFQNLSVAGKDTYWKMSTFLNLSDAREGKIHLATIDIKHVCINNQHLC